MDDSMALAASQPEDEEPGVSFFPPLYVKRYSAVASIVESCAESGMKLSKLLDVGCAECKFLRHVIGFPFLREISGLDVDEKLLERCKRAVDPLLTDYLHKQRDNQVVTLYSGSIAERDEILLDYDVVTAIEVIEHLYPDVLHAMVTSVFEYMRPKLVVMTTPNSEFNVLFPDFSGFRHWDHKFEWTRAQFQQWADELASKYQYSVSYRGVGDPPESYSHLGCCSQMAVFTRNEDKTANLPDRVLSHTTKYKQVYKVLYKGHHLSEEQQLKYDVYAYLSSMHCWGEDGDLLPLADMDSLLERLKSLSRSSSLGADSETLDTIEELAKIIEETDYQLTEDRTAVVINKGDRSYFSDTQSNSDGSDTDMAGEIATNSILVTGLLEEDDSWELD